MKLMGCHDGAHVMFWRACPVLFFLSLASEANGWFPGQNSVEFRPQQNLKHSEAYSAASLPAGPTKSTASQPPLTLPCCGTYLQGGNRVDVQGDSTSVYPAHCRDQRPRLPRGKWYGYRAPGLPSCRTRSARAHHQRVLKLLWENGSL